MNAVLDARYPRFVEGPANVTGNLPYVGYEALLQGFLFEGDRAKLQRICDRLLNEPANGATQFVVASSYIFACGLYQPRMQSDDPVDQGAGYVSEIDFGFWILTLGGLRDHPLSWRLRWLPVWLFVDTGAAIATGREVFGYPKMQARFLGKSPAPGDPTDASVAIRTNVWDRIHHDACAQEAELLRLCPASDWASHVGPNLEWDEGSSSKQFQEQVSGHPSFRGHGFDWTSLLPPMFSMPMVFLKQFRHSSLNRRACYQAIVEVDVECSALHRIGLFASKYRLEINNYPSHPLAQLLGLSPSQESAFGVWLKQDFRVPFGNVLWEA